MLHIFMSIRHSFFNIGKELHKKNISFKGLIEKKKIFNVGIKLFNEKVALKKLFLGTYSLVFRSKKHLKNKKYLE